MVEFSSGLEFMIDAFEKPPLAMALMKIGFVPFGFPFAAVPGCMVYVTPSPSPKMLIMVAILGKTITDEKNWMDFPSSLDSGSNAFQKAWSKNAAAPLWMVSCLLSFGSSWN